jgi:hypothetical protein
MPVNIVADLMPLNIVADLMPLNIVVTFYLQSNA